MRWFAEQQVWGCDRCRQTFPAQPQLQQQMPPQAAPAKKSKAPLLIVAGVVVVGGIVAAVVIATSGGKKDGRIDLENQELQAVRDDVCKCKDEACQKEAVDRIDIIIKSAEGAGEGTKEQRALGMKTMDEIGACLDKASPAVAEMTAIRDEMCACKDAACAQALQVKIDAFGKQYLPKFESMPHDVRKKVMAVTEAEVKCRDAVLAASIPVYAGSYKTSEGAMTLEQKAADPSTVTGTYAKGTIACKAKGSELACVWKEPSSSGHAKFKRAANGDMSGSWGLDSASSGGGTWTCTLLTDAAMTP